MGVPDVNERVKEVPARGLRAMFAGIGQMLSVRDKVRGKPGASPEPEADGRETDAPAAASPQAGATEPAAADTAAADTAAAETAAAEAVAQESAVPEAAAAEPVVTKRKAATRKAAPAPDTAGGHVKLLPPDEIPADAAPEPAAVPVSEPAPEPVAAVVPKSAPEPVAAAAAPIEAEAAAPATMAEAAPSAAELPLQNYDSLTIASLRARLRNLSTDQLTQLIDYEKGHAGRADVIAMFERRIAKLAEG